MTTTYFKGDLAQYTGNTSYRVDNVDFYEILMLEGAEQGKLKWTSTPPKKYYVSVVEGSKYALMAGPYDTHDEALADVDTVREIAYARDPRAHFMEWGTVGCSSERGQGLLNELGLI